MSTVLIHKLSSKTGKKYTAIDVYISDHRKKRVFLNGHEADLALANSTLFDVVEVDD